MLQGGTELDAQIAQALSVPVLMLITGHPNMTVQDYYNLAVRHRGRLSAGVQGRWESAAVCASCVMRSWDWAGLCLRQWARPLPKP